MVGEALSDVEARRVTKKITGESFPVGRIYSLDSLLEKEFEKGRENHGLVPFRRKCSDGDERYEDSEEISNIPQQPEPPPSICEDMEPVNTIQLSGTKSGGSQYNTYTYSYTIKSCGSEITFDVYLKGSKRLLCENGYIPYESFKSKSNTISSLYDFGLICIYSPTTEEMCSEIS